MYKTFHIRLHERAVVLAHGIPREALGPGRHTAWGFGLSALRFDTRGLLFDIPDAIAAALPSDWYATVTLGAEQRGVLSRRGVPTAFLRPGVHSYWTVDKSVGLDIYDVTQPVPSLTDELFSIVPGSELVETTVLEYQRGLLYREGRFERRLPPGRYALWTTAASPVSIGVVDMRRKQLVVPGQDILTRDKVSLRVTLTVDFAPTDAETAPHTIANPEAALYSIAQLALRDFVAGVTLDELLESREALTRYLSHHTEEHAQRFGVRILTIGVRDVILPGEMKVLLNRVIEAEKQAAANVILRKEEAAAVRTLANAAKVMADNPVLLRMKELESFERIAANVNEVKLAVGKEGLESLLPRLRELAE